MRSSADSECETAEELIERKQEQWAKERDQPVRTKDIRRRGSLSWRREAWTPRPQSNYRAKVFSIERFRLVGEDGERAYADGAVLGDVEYRFGYGTVGRLGRAAGRWVWGQYSPQIPAADLEPLLDPSAARADPPPYVSAGLGCVGPTDPRAIDRM